MDESRRGFIAMSATLAASAVLPGETRAADAPGAAVPQNLAETADLRLATFSPPANPRCARAWCSTMDASSTSGATRSEGA